MDVLTVKQLQDLLQVSRATIYRLLVSGLPSFLVGGQRRFERAQVLAWLRRQPASPTPPVLPLLLAGTYACASCHWTGRIAAPTTQHPTRCPGCGLANPVIVQVETG